MENGTKLENHRNEYIAVHINKLVSELIAENESLRRDNILLAQSLENEVQ